MPEEVNPGMLLISVHNPSVVVEPCLPSPSNCCSM
jgi:hypothetical protein